MTVERVCSFAQAVHLGPSMQIRKQCLCPDKACVGLLGALEKYGCEFMTEMKDMDGELSRIYVKKIKDVD